MTKLKVASKRVRPLLGTFVEISLYSEGDFSDLVTDTFEFGQRLEKIFNVHDINSEISLFNLGKSQEPGSHLLSVLNLAQDLEIRSNHAFSSRDEENFLNLNGIAKGYIVDKLVENILRQVPHLQGVINAGGDLRFFNTDHRVANIRMGNKPIFREISLNKNALATSSVAISQSDANSSTNYHKPLARGLRADHTVTVLADYCAIADALTKVALFGSLATIEKCASVFSSQIMIFDAQGDIVEVYSEHEVK